MRNMQLTLIARDDNDECWKEGDEFICQCHANGLAYIKCRKGYHDLNDQNGDDLTFEQVKRGESDQFNVISTATA